MAVTFRGKLEWLFGASGFSIQTGIDGTIGAVTFAQPFLETPRVFCEATADELIYVSAVSTTGLTTSTASASSSGSGTTFNYIAIGRGALGPIGRVTSHELGDMEYGACTIDSALTYPGAYTGNPTVFASPTSDESLHIISDSSTGFTPTESTGAGGSGSTANYLAIGAGHKHKSLGLTSTSGSQIAPTYLEIGTYAALSAVTFYEAFKATPKIFVCPTSDGRHYAASSATTGFTPTTITLGGKGAGAAGNYLAIGVKNL